MSYSMKAQQDKVNFQQLVIAFEPGIDATNFKNSRNNWLGVN